jgi:hypothetical protein
MPDKEILAEIGFHSAVGIDSFFQKDKRHIVARIPNGPKVASSFTAAGGTLLIHKTSKSLWKLSPDKSFIEPVFATDVLSEDDLTSMEEN